MTTLVSAAPWAIRLVTDRLPASPPPYATVTLDPATQTARYFDLSGQLIEIGKHGTNKTIGTASFSGGAGYPTLIRLPKPWQTF